MIQETLATNNDKDLLKGLSICKPETKLGNTQSIIRSPPQNADSFVRNGNTLDYLCPGYCLLGVLDT